MTETRQARTTLEMRWRRAHALDLGLANLGIFLFAALPTSTLIPVEIVIMAAAAFCFVGVIAHALPRRVPGARWSYAATGVTALTTCAVYGQVEGVPAHIKVPYLFLVLACSASAYAAHVIDGASGDG